VGDLPLTLGASVFYGDDSYLQSDIGLDSGLDRRYGVDLNWTVSEKLSAYASAGREKIDARMRNSSTFSWPDWKGVVQDDFETYGAGVAMRVNDKVRFNADYTYGNGDTRTQIVGVGAGRFPGISSELSSFKAGVTYGWNARTDLVATYWYETLSTRDWQFSSSPTPTPTILALGVDPYNYDVNVVTLSVRYRFGGVEPTKEEAAE
jgi:hypothetical protein